MPTFVVPNSYGSLREFNPCHQPAKSTTAKPGTFAPKGQGVCRGGSGSAPAPPSRQLPAHESSLKTGSVASSEPLGGGANVTMIVEIETPEGLVKTVYKPEIGEVWRGNFANKDINKYLNNREFSLAEREAAAYEVDQILGTNVVPETVLRERVEAAIDETELEPEMDEDDLRAQYDEWKEKQIDKAYDAVGEKMGELESEAAQEYVSNVMQRVATEVVDIWNELVDTEFPDTGPDYGADIDEHPVLRTAPENRPPLGPDETYRTLGFNPRKRHEGVVDPFDVLLDADVNVDGPLNRDEKDAVREVLRQRMRDGAQELGNVDPDRVREYWQDKKRDEWMEEHQDTEARLLDAEIKSFTAWKKDQGFGERVRNDDAPHPRGGSLQRFVENGSFYNDFHRESAYRMAVLDYVIGSLDRHHQNVISTDDKSYAIDNGYSFPDGPATLRSKAVDHIMRDPMPETLRSQLADRVKTANWESFFDRHPSMSEKERTAMLQRIMRMSAALETTQGVSTLWYNTPRL